MKKNIRIIFIFFTFILFIGTVNLFADGFIVVPQPQPLRTPFPLEVKYHRVNVEIRDRTATTYVDQEFYNPTGVRLEGYYIFPIPGNAVIKKFSMFINGTETEAELLNADKARQIYEDIVRKALDPAILEYQGRGIFKARIFPIEARSVKRVKISYTEMLETDTNTTEYVYPLNTEKFSAKALNDVSINVDIKSSEELKNIYCTSHRIDVVRKGKFNAMAAYEQKNVRPDADFRIYFGTDKSELGISVLCYREQDRGHFFLSISPGFDLPVNRISRKDITFVLDVSGSMAGEKLEQAKKALLFCVNNLNRNDRFQIIRFSTEAESIFSSPEEADKENIIKARNYINDFRAIGGTHIEEALTMALSSKESKEQPHMIVFITDGQPTIGETGEEKLVDIIKKANTENIRIFTFGIGNDINTHLLDKITSETRAYRTYISPDEDIEIKISNFYSKVQSPVLTDLKLAFGRNIKTYRIYPKELPDLFRDSSLSVLGEYSGFGKTHITLEGMINGKTEKFEYDIAFPEKSTENDTIPYLWAARHVGYLLDQIRLNGENRELIDEITETARKYGIVTPYTSYLILEDERGRLSRGDLRPADMTIGNVAERARDFDRLGEAEYKSIKQKSGAGSVRQSREFQSMFKADNAQDAAQGASRIVKDNIGGTRNIQGRAVYNAGDVWIDSRIQEKNIGKSRRIQFASREYFDLLKKKPMTAQFMSLGKNVRFVFDDELYEIFE